MGTCKWCPASYSTDLESHMHEMGCLLRPDDGIAEIGRLRAEIATAQATIARLTADLASAHEAGYVKGRADERTSVVDGLHARATEIVDDRRNPEHFRALVKAARYIARGDHVKGVG